VPKSTSVSYIAAPSSVEDTDAIETAERDFEKALTNVDDSTCGILWTEGFDVEGNVRTGERILVSRPSVLCETPTVSSASEASEELASSFVAELVEEVLLNEHKSLLEPAELLLLSPGKSDDEPAWLRDAAENNYDEESSESTHRTDASSNTDSVEDTTTVLFKDAVVIVLQGVLPPETLECLASQNASVPMSSNARVVVYKRSRNVCIGNYVIDLSTWKNRTYKCTMSAAPSEIAPTRGKRTNVSWLHRMKKDAHDRR